MHSSQHQQAVVNNRSNRLMIYLQAQTGHSLTLLHKNRLIRQAPAGVGYSCGLRRARPYHSELLLKDAKTVGCLLVHDAGVWCCCCLQGK
jgi:hypothetical protein